MQFTLLPARQKTTLAAVFAALFALAPAAHAQTMASPAQRPAAAPKPAAAPAPDDNSKDDPAKVAAARDFLMAYRPRLNPKFAESQLDKFKAEMIARVRKENPKVDANAFVEQRRATVLARIGVELDRQSHLVSRYFTLQELKDLATFFGHGVGKKLTDVTPKIQMEMMRQRRVASGLPGSGKPGAMQLKTPDSSKTPLNSSKASPPPKK